MPGTRPGMTKSVRAAAAFTKIGKRLVGEAIEFAGLSVALDLLIEARGVECLEPVAKSGELVGRELGDGFFEVFDGHSSICITTSRVGKGAPYPP